MFDHNGDHMKKSHRGVAKFGIALGLGPRDFAGSNPVTPTKKPPEVVDFRRILISLS